MARVIVLQGCPRYNEDGIASEEIRPGHLVKGVTSIAKQTSSAKVPAAFALEREELGKGIDNTYGGTTGRAGSAYYSIGDTVKVGVFAAGDRVNALIDSGVNVAADAILEPAANGTLRALASGHAIARALEAKNVTETSFIKVEIL
jgi:hypothetical protein